jgi:hypothetical protein
VISLLAWLSCRSDGLERSNLGGGKYVWPRAGVKFGRVDAVETNLLRDEKIESCLC